MNLIFGGALQNRFIEKSKKLTCTKQIYAFKNIFFLPKDKKFVVMSIELLKSDFIFRIQQNEIKKNLYYRFI